ncbi:MAG TPA: COX15/CtaA family protein [Anaerolineales bacterium]|nr:COX15/CtaA family protein [Anaerolineales bacterium]
MRNRTLSYYSWLILAYTVAVILWGAYVRATGSGAGCGSHWPLCDGVVVPRSGDSATAIEFTHRLMTGILLPLVLILVVWTIRRRGKGDPARTGAIASLIFLLIESLIGAGLVRFELVAQNSSPLRALAVSIHLTNTLFLLGSLTLTAWWLSGGGRIRLTGNGSKGWVLGIALGGLILASASGAITALGDTLFPAGSLAEGIQADLSPVASFLVRLRAIHPALAITFGIYSAVVALVLGPIRGEFEKTAIAWWAAGLVGLQLVLGAINIALLAPLWMQMVHLLTADMVWIAMVLLTAEIFSVTGAHVEDRRLQTEELEDLSAAGSKATVEN